jgi:hypothetical protein
LTICSFHHERRRELAAATGLCRTLKKENEVKESDIKRLRRRLRGMSNPELLLFGVTAKCQCSLATETDHPPPEDILQQLSEARKEWRKRNPSLPLSDSF